MCECCSSSRNAKSQHQWEHSLLLCRYSGASLAQKVVKFTTVEIACNKNLAMLGQTLMPATRDQKCLPKLFILHSSLLAGTFCYGNALKSVELTQKKKDRKNDSIMRRKVDANPFSQFIYYSFSLFFRIFLSSSFLARSLFICGWAEVCAFETHSNNLRCLLMVPMGTSSLGVFSLSLPISRDCCFLST